MTVPIVPTMKPLRNFPTKKTALVVATNSTPTATKVITKAMSSVNRRPMRSAISADAIDATIALIA